MCCVEGFMAKSSASDSLDIELLFYKPTPKRYTLNRGNVEIKGCLYTNSPDEIVAVEARLGKRAIPLQLTATALGYCRVEGSFSTKPGIKHVKIHVKFKSGETRQLTSLWVFQLSRKAHTLIENKPETDYQDWVDRMEQSVMETIFEKKTQLYPLPELNWVIQVNNKNLDALQCTLDSLFKLNSLSRIILLDSVGLFDERSALGDTRLICLKNPSVSSINTQLLGIKKGLICFLNQGDVVSDSLERALEKIDLTQSSLIYTDHDSVDVQGNRSDPEVKPAWNPDFLRSTPYIGRNYFITVEQFTALEGFKNYPSDLKHWDLQLRLSSSVKRNAILRLPGIYFHQYYSFDSSVQPKDVLAVITDFVKSENPDARAVHHEKLSGSFRIQYPLPESEDCPKVSLIIPTRDGVEVLKVCVDTILEKTNYPNYEVIILDNDSKESETVEYFDQITQKGCRIIPCPGKFNYAAINNRGVENAEGSYICLLNSDLEVIDGDWLNEMMAHAVRPSVGAVGAHLLYPDDRLQHAGVILGVGHVAAHAYRFLEPEGAVDPKRAKLVNNYTALTAACLLMRKAIFEEVGGFDAENLAITYNDVDLCIKIYESGYYNVYTPHATLYHHESATRGPEDTPEKKQRYLKEVEYMWKRWENILLDDPAYNPMLTRFKEDFTLTTPHEQKLYRNIPIFPNE